MTDIVDELRARALQGRFNLEAADEIERLRAELSEQCRLLGMSGEREAKHLAQIAALEKERDDLRDQVGAWIKANAPGGWIDTMRAELAQHRAARIAYASEFDGDVDSIHENIRNLKKERDALAVKVPDEIERLRAELKDRETFIEGYREQSVEDVALYIEKLRTAELERDALRAELDALKGRKHLGTLHDDGYFLWREGQRPPASNYAGWSMKLYAHPVSADVPEGWLRAIDEALVVTHLGVANAEDSYEDAKRKLDALIGWHCDVVTDPAVNGGWKLVPVEILDRFPEINQNNYNHDDVCNLNAWGVELVLAAAPGAKS